MCEETATRKTPWWTPQRWYQSTGARARAALLLIPAAGSLLVWWSGTVVHGCRDAHLALSFGGTPSRVRDLAPACAVSTERWGLSLALDSGGAILYGLGLALTLLGFWRFGWRSRRQGSLGVATVAAAVPLAAAALDLAENAVAYFAVQPEPDGLRVGAAAAAALATLGLAKWLLLVVALGALFLTLYGAGRFRAITLVDWTKPPAPKSSEPPPKSGPDIAVCLSGGGIRSAAFAWGALRRLQTAGKLGSSTTMYSVSGGGYAALAASQFGVTSKPAGEDVVLDPTDYVKEHHRYLDSMRGGLMWALVKALVAVMINLVVVLAGVVVLGLPVGLLARTRFGAVASSVDGTGVKPGTIRDGAWLPVLVLLAMAGLVVAASWATSSPRHRKVWRAAVGVVGVAAVLTVVWIAVPWLAHRLGRVWSASWWATVPAALTWVLGVLATLLRPRLAKAAARLGGVLVVLGLVYAFVYTVRRAVAVDARPGWDWLPDAWDSTLHWGLIGLVAAVVLVVIDWTGVQWWSLHPLYRDRLANAFAFRQNGQKLEALPWRLWPRWAPANPPSPDAGPNDGPQHVVCAATHRRKDEVTGLRSISMRFSSQGVAYFEPMLEGTAVEVFASQGTAEWLDSAYGVALGAVENSAHSHVRATKVAAVAMSGAAFNSTMGRASRGSTDSLLAVLNLRLGVWMPNPRFSTHGDRRFPRPGLRYLFHEVIAHYDVEDPFVHVSDGGHWENLGLTEALRDRPKFVVVVDASGGAVAPPEAGEAGAGFAALREAADLARVEIPAEIEVDVQPMRPLATTGRAPQNWALGTTIFHTDRGHTWEGCGCQSVPVLYVKAVVCDRTSAAVLSYANTDRKFPDYSTADQFLTDDQFEMLARLGEEAITSGLEDLAVRTAQTS